MATIKLLSANSKQANFGNSTWRDWLGITASVGCAIHCAAMPFVIAYLPALGLNFLADEAFHKWMALACFLIALMAFVPGIRKHGNWTPVLTGVMGLALITLSAFGMAGECCASCDANESSDGQASVFAASTGDEEVCDQCEECQACAQNEVGLEELTIASQKDSENNLLSMLSPWITPLGGLLLISAHLLNRRYGCLCGCC